MNVSEVLEEIKKAGSEQTKKTLLKHGAREPFYGTKVEDLKKIKKKIKENKQEIALELFESGISDAQYLAGLMADGSRMTRDDLQHWAEIASWSMVSQYSVPWVTCENPEAFEIALDWIDSENPKIATSGWTTLSAICSVWPDDQIDQKKLKKLLIRVEKEIYTAPNLVRYCMNGFVIAVGSFVKALSDDAMRVGKKIGEVEVDMNGTHCKVPFVLVYIQKVIDKGYLGRKKKTAKC